MQNPASDSHKHFEDAVQLHQQGHQKQAQTLYKKVLEMDPNHDQAHFLLGVVYHQSGDDNQAINFILKALALNNNHCVYHYQLAKIYKDHNQRKAAQQHFILAIKNHYSFEEAYCELATLYQDTRHYSKALRLLQKGREHCPNSVCIIEKQAIIEKACHHIPQAVHLFLTALEIDPKQAECMNHLAEIYLRAGELSKAESMLSSLLTEHPNHFEGYNNLGQLHFVKQQYEQALTAYQRAEQLQPHAMETQLYIADTQRALTDHYAAIKKYQAILQNVEAKLNKYQRYQTLAGLCLSYHALDLPQAKSLCVKLSEKITHLKLSAPIILSVAEAQALQLPVELIEKIHQQTQFHQQIYTLPNF